MIEGAGTTLKAAVDILRKYGAVPETMLPFKINTTMYTGNENTFYATAATRKIASYFNLQRNLANWRSWLGQHGPILVGLNVDATWDSATVTGGKLDTFQPSTVRGGHAVALVGYTPDNRFILRNSWGTTLRWQGFRLCERGVYQCCLFRRKLWSDTVIASEAPRLSRICKRRADGRSRKS